MRRLRRILWNVTTAGSLVLCVALAGLWVRSYWVEEVVGWFPKTPRPEPRGYGTRPVGIVSVRGGLTLMATLKPDRFEHAGLYYDGSPAYPGADSQPPSRRFLGFGHERLDWKTGREVLELWRVPMYAPVCLTALLPAVWVARRLRRRRHPAGACPGCGYDLRATPDRCPECGRVA